MTELTLDPVLTARLPPLVGMAQALRTAGVPVTVEFVEGVTHGHLNVPGLPSALRSLVRMATFLTPPPSP